MMPELHVLA